MMLMTPGRAQSSKRLFELRASSGYAQRMLRPVETSDQLINDHNEKLRRGYYVDGGLVYHINEFFGVGAFVNYFRTDNRSPDANWRVFFNNSWNFYTGYLEDQYDIYEYSLRFNVRVLEEGRFRMSLGLGPGYTDFTHRGHYIVAPFIVSGNTASLDVMMALRYELESGLYIGIQGTYQSAFLQLNESNLQYNGPIPLRVRDTDIRRLNIGVLLSYSFGRKSPRETRGKQHPQPKSKKLPKRFR